MLYSPLLSCLRFLICVPWVLVVGLLQFLNLIFFKKHFFFFYKIFFNGLRKIFGIKINLSGFPERKNVLFISNHISYLDILVLGSLINAVFVAKSDIKTWPIINKLCLIGKTIFIDRENTRLVGEQMRLIEKNMKEGINVILFPEGTSSDGSKVLKFKSSLFKLIDSEKLEDFRIQPISITYNKLDGLPLDKFFRPFLAWFGGMDLLSHAWKFLGLGISEVNVKFHDPKNFKFFSDRKHACRFSYEIISNQVKQDYRSLEIDNKIKLYEFKFL